MTTLRLLVTTFCLGVSAAHAAPCKLPGAAMAALRPGNVILVGEVPGTRELPAFIGELTACALDKVVGVWVALDLPSREQDDLHAWLSSEGTPVDRKRLLSGAFWQRARQDGRSSVAMLDLLEQLRALTAAGRNLRVLAFDPAPPEGVDLDQAKAAVLVKQLGELGGKVAIVLTSNAHARTVADEGMPMGKRLFTVHRDLTALTHEVRGGEAFQCREAGCAVWPVEGIDQGAERTVQLYPMPDANGFHGMVYTPTVTASPPAIHPTP